MESLVTSLLVIDRGVILLEEHRARLGSRWRAEFDDFARTAIAGVWRVDVSTGVFNATRRAASSLSDGIPTRYRPSPLVALRGVQPKSGAAVWDTVRLPGVATLLTDATGTEIYEACVAAVVAWDGMQLVAPPVDRPRVASIAAVHLLAHEPHTPRPLLVSEALPLLLINAVALTCAPRGSTFPSAVRERLHARLLATAARS